MFNLRYENMLIITAPLITSDCLEHEVVNISFSTGGTILSRTIISIASWTIYNSPLVKFISSRKYVDTSIITEITVPCIVVIFLFVIKFFLMEEK